MSSKLTAQNNDKEVVVVECVEMTSAEKQRRRLRNIAIGVVLGGLFVLFYIMTIARLGANVLSRPF